MRIKSLELVGFKSFVDRTVIRFELGITGVVGPNGAGKSNVVDAIRWVMGEQSARHLRGDDMQDVIFSGSQKRNPMGMASVFLTFDNSDGRAPAEYSQYAEITVGRRLYRSGESEYFINKTPCRLRDIVDLFLGTGTGTKAYSIVEQGQIGRIVSAKPEERRFFIEEAAGISKFKHRREMAQRKMDATRQNLLRLRDIIAELDRQMASLDRQVKKAEKYKIYAAELRTVELAHAAHQWQGLHAARALAESRLQALHASEVGRAAEVGALENAIESGRLAVADIERELATAQERAYVLQNTIHLVEAKVDHKVRDRRDTENRVARATHEIEVQTERVALWRADVADVNAMAVAADLAVAGATDTGGELAAQLASFTSAMDAFSASVQQEQQAVVDAVQTVSSTAKQLEHVESRTADIATQITTREDALGALAARIAALQDAVGQGRAALSREQQATLQLGEERVSVEQMLAQQAAELAQLEQHVSEQQSTLQQARSRLQSLQELADNFEGYQEGVKAILRTREEESGLPGILGTVAEQIQTDSRFEAAVGAALGERIQGVLVQSQLEGIGALQYLKSQARGRGTFIPFALRWPMPEATAAPIQGDGIIGPLADVVQCSDGFAAVARYLLGNIVLVEDLSAALRAFHAHQGSTTFVTLDGEMVDPAGVVTGGGSGDQAQAILARKRELAALAPQVTRLQTDVDAALQRKSRLVTHIEGLRRQLAVLSQDRHDKELRLVHQQKDLAHEESEVARLRDEQRDGAHWLMQQRQLLATLASERDTMQVRLARAQGAQQQAGAALARAQTESEGVRREREAVAAALTTCRAELASHEERARSAAREIERLVAALVAGQRSIGEQQAQVSECRVLMAAAERDEHLLREQLGRTVRAAEDGSARQCEIQQRYQTGMDTLREQEARVRGVRKDYDQALQEKHAAEMALAQHREKMHALHREISDRYRLDLEVTWQDYCPADFDAVAAAAQVDDLRHKIERLGGVNVDAIEESAELTQRHEFLTRQAADLDASIDALQRAIHKINRVSRERFRTTFEAINVRFEQLFPKLFRGGQARLLLTDEDNLLEAGVEIVAQPPGKKLQSVTLLSGGEKALTAVAMIFAMFLVRPSPFCLLDEVDAPLDDANIDRFNEMIRDMIAHAQFILITHNKRTMELADTLYGVTMEEPGVSKIVSVRLKVEAGADASADATNSEPAVA